MIRFFILSLLLHFAVYGLLTWKPNPVIYDGILTVELNPLQNPISSSHQKPAPKPKTLVKAAASTTPASAATKTADEISTTNSAANASTAPLESSLVTTNPRVLKQVKAAYPQEAKQAGVQGAVKLSVIINPSGHVQEVSVLEGPGYGLNETAQEALKQFIFSPAELHGEKVSVRIVYIYRFRLDTR